LCFQSDLEKEKKELHKDHKSKQTSILKEKLKMNKNSASLHSRLDNINMSLELLRSEQLYNMNMAVNDTNREERCHFAMVIQTRKDEGKKMKEESRQMQSYSMVCSLSYMMNIYTCIMLTHSNTLPIHFSTY